MVLRIYSQNISSAIPNWWGRASRATQITSLAISDANMYSHSVGGDVYSFLCTHMCKVGQGCSGTASLLSHDHQHISFYHSSPFYLFIVLLSLVKFDHHFPDKSPIVYIRIIGELDLVSVTSTTDNGLLLAPSQ